MANVELELSIMSRGPDTAESLTHLLAQFEAERRVAVNLNVLTWETGWAELVRYALYGQGPDVSEIGSTWVASLAAMGTLRPYDKANIAAIGQPTTFLPAAWSSASLEGEEEIWAIPWLANTRCIFYRVDLLTRAGIDPAMAFKTAPDLEQTLQRLQAAGVACPWVTPTRNTVNTLHTVAAWVWGAQGNFVNAQGTQTLFNAPEARAGIRAYFNLQRYMSPDARSLDNQQAEEFFVQGKAAVMISDPGVLYLLQHNADPHIAAQVATAVTPGVPFVGGSNLVMWKFSRRQREALELIRFLVSHKAQTMFSPNARSLPVRQEALASPPFSTEALYQPIVASLHTGRSYRIRRLWGLFEEKLIAGLNQVWADIFANPEADLDAILNKHFDPLAKRLDLALSGGR